MTGVGISLRILDETARKAIITPQARPSISPSSLAFSMFEPIASLSSSFTSVIPTPSSSSSFCYIAMVITAPKHIIMATISKGIIGSLSIQNATREIQKGLVYHITMIKEIGARGAAIFNRTKFP